MNNLIKDISTLTSISERALSNLIEMAEKCIAHCVLENIFEKNCLTEVDIGIGTLYIKLEEEGIKYKFIPSNRLEEEVSYTIQNKDSPVILSADKALKERIENVHKQML